MKLLSGNSNKPLSKNIAKYLRSKLVNSSIRNFSDGEIYVEINENIRGNSIFIIQSVSSPANDNLMELLLCIDALKRSSAKNITAVIPYFGYARQDRKVVPRTSISAKLVSNLITKAGADRVVTVDLHAGQIQGFFDIPVDNLFATPIFARHAKKKIKSKNVICVAPDVGGTERARALGKLLNVGLAIVDKRRPKPGQSQVMNVIGDVKGKTCVIVDDIIDSGGTIVNAAKALKDRGAKDVYVYITHGVLSGDAVKKIKNSVIKNLVITDTIDNIGKTKNVKNIEVLPISGVMGEAIKRISNSTFLLTMFNTPPLFNPGDFSWLMNWTGTSILILTPGTTLKKSTWIGSSVIMWYLISLGRTFWGFPSTFKVTILDKKFSLSIKVLSNFFEMDTFSFWASPP